MSSPSGTLTASMGIRAGPVLQVSEFSPVGWGHPRSQDHLAAAAADSEADPGLRQAPLPQQPLPGDLRTWHVLAVALALAPRPVTEKHRLTEAS